MCVNFKRVKLYENITQNLRMIERTFYVKQEYLNIV